MNDKGRAFPRSAENLYLSAHHICQVLDDGQSQPGASEAPVDTDVSLGERGK